MTDFAALLGALVQEEVDFVIVGGLAATIHGSSRLTQDVDIVYDQPRSNLRRLHRALAPHDPYLRGAPPGLPFDWSVETLERGLNFTLTTDLGAIDLFGELPGVGGYGELRPHSRTVALFGYECRCIELDWLIRAKRAAGRPKDLEVLAELEALADERMGPE